MNLGAIARSLSNSLRFGTGSKKQSSASSTPPISPKEAPAQPQEESHPQATAGEDQQRRGPYKQTVELILDKVSELEHTLYEDQQQEFKLRMALEQQTERVHELNFALDTERQRNERLVELLRGVDTDSCSESEHDSHMLSGMRLDSKGDLYGSISPMLMQQRYDDLNASHRQAHRLLAKKDKAIKLLRCDLEELRGKYDAMYDDYRSEHRRLETLYSRYMNMQQKRKQQICILKETLGYASECILHAQQTFESYANGGSGIQAKHMHDFNRNLEFFMRSLRNCCCLRRLQQLQMEPDQPEAQPEDEHSMEQPLGREPEKKSKHKHRHRKRHKH